MAVGIVIPTYAHFEYAQLAIESACRTPDATIIVVDDGSPTWPSERIIRGWIPSDVPFVIQRYDKNARSLSRSWNTGLRIARNLGCEFAVCGNADLVFPVGWWESMRESLDRFDFVGPVTNAPGHGYKQDIKRYLYHYSLSDDPDDIDETQEQISHSITHPIPKTILNGFCFAGRTESFERLGGFDQSLPMEGNEDDFFRRAGDMGMTLGICVQSFVFHYRSVARGLKRGRLDGGAVRLAGCGGCGGLLDPDTHAGVSSPRDSSAG